MRVTGGVWRSRRLRGPTKGQKLRPTPDAMRERCFAIFGNTVSGSRVLDLFAGTGAVGIEALSRGSTDAVFVEAHRGAAKLISSNLESLGIEGERATLMIRPASRAISTLKKSGHLFDLVWADPPFEIWRDGLDILGAVVEAGLATNNSTLCLECPAEAVLGPDLPAGLVLERDIKGGASRVVILRKM